MLLSSCGVIVDIVRKMFFCTGYVTNLNSFPKPLSTKEEREYLEKLKDGDEKAKNILIERNLRLVAHVAKKYSGGTNHD